MASDDFTLYVTDLLEPLGRVQPKRLFGGQGLYRDGLIFALVMDDTLYLCADDEMRAAFKEMGTGPFRYTSRGREIEIGRYHEVPSSVLDDGDELIMWARHALGAAKVPAASARAKRRTPKQ